MLLLFFQVRITLSRVLLFPSVLLKNNANFDNREFPTPSCRRSPSIQSPCITNAMANRSGQAHGLVD